MATECDLASFEHIAQLRRLGGLQPAVLVLHKSSDLVPVRFRLPVARPVEELSQTSSDNEGTIVAEPSKADVLFEKRQIRPKKKEKQRSSSREASDSRQKPADPLLDRRDESFSRLPKSRSAQQTHSHRLKHADVESESDISINSARQTPLSGRNMRAAPRSRTPSVADSSSGLRVNRLPKVDAAEVKEAKKQLFNRLLDDRQKQERELQYRIDGDYPVRRNDDSAHRRHSDTEYPRDDDSEKRRTKKSGVDGRRYKEPSHKTFDQTDSRNSSSLEKCNKAARRKTGRKKKQHRSDSFDAVPAHSEGKSREKERAPNTSQYRRRHDF